MTEELKTRIEIEEPHYRIERLALAGETIAIVLRWHTAEPPLTSERFRAALRSMADVVDSSRPGAMVIDAREFQYAVSTEDQEWRDARITPRYTDAGVRRCAYIVNVVPTEPRGYSGAGFETRFFDASTDAIAWARFE